MFLRNYRNKGKVDFQHSQKGEVYKKNPQKGGGVTPIYHSGSPQIKLWNL